ncbi:MAG: alpha-1,4-glucan--maltose-1-phosphate maltosyltransferase [Isosphaeraceae bacterium]
MSATGGAEKLGGKAAGPGSTSIDGKKAVSGRAPSRVIVEAVSPEIDAGRFPIKRVVGEEVVVSADVFAEGHDVVRAAVLFRTVGAPEWSESPMSPLVNDRWVGRFTPTEIGRAEYTVIGWVDAFESWRRELGKKVEAGQDVSSELLEGGLHVLAGSRRASGDDAVWLLERSKLLGRGGDQADRIAAALDPELCERMERHPDRSGAFTYEPALGLMVERERARYGSWYELFPRSCATEPGKHGTFRDLEARLPYIAGMGFDVVYLPPIHPIGRAFRKGPNNTLTPGPGDPGSPWAIGGPEGGHKAVLPELGTLDDFDRVVASARALGMEIALDIAFQCSPDHPYVKEHPGWFRQRPDGTIKYAENPPKKYQDIYPIDFDCEDWRALWAELRDVFLFWVGHGVKVFRVDNPHTKPFRFWEWCLGEVWDRHPDTIFLSEAFTRPKVMKELAKMGFTQSYSYFTWRNDKHGLTEYFTELTRTECVEYMRPNLFANTPDILHEYLQYGGRPAFMARLILAATLGATYGIYGPTFELCVGQALRHGSEEYLDSEKYQVRHWNLDDPVSLRNLVTRVNEIRRGNLALQDNRSLRFFHTDNDQIICYGKSTPDLSNLLIMVVNLDPYHTQSGFVSLPCDELGLGHGSEGSYQVHDLISDARYVWQGPTNYVELNPHVCPAHVFRVRRKFKSEQDFDYYR